MELPKKFRMARIASYCSNEFQQKIGAVIFSGKSPISIGFNHKKSHPIFANEDNFYTYHAETHALFNIPFGVTVKNASMYVYREHNTSKTPMLSRPCDNCLAHIILYGGIKKIYFTTEDWYDIIKL
jgi:deoxycytidylate deaminase